MRNVLDSNDLATYENMMVAVLLDEPFCGAIFAKNGTIHSSQRQRIDKNSTLGYVLVGTVVRAATNRGGRHVLLLWLVEPTD